ncbi:MAG: tetratricopeptide (TPR) repeat protein [Myxococcota bacterium]|jgi:tetratricopeptide (TPR) repeat protein
MQPWSTIFLTALSGKHRQSRMAIACLPRRTPSEDRPRLAAISARALLAMGDAAEAGAALERARHNLEAVALRSVMGFSISAITRRVDVGIRGMSADAACDLAWLHRQRCDHAGAVDAIQEALSRCPEHIEARLWCHALQDPDLARFATRLSPTEQTGWLSAERIVRRPVGSVLSPTPDSALSRLTHAGIPCPQLASEIYYDSLPGGHSLVELEARVAEVTALRRMGYPGGALLKSAWMHGQRHPPHIIQQLSRVVMELAIFDPSAAQVGLAAATVMRHRTDCPKLEALYVRFLASHDHPLALSSARSALRKATDPANWALIVDALHRLDRPDEARAEAERALGIPVLASAAFSVLISWEGRTA